MEARVSNPALMQGFIFFFADSCVLNVYMFIHIRRWPDHRRFHHLRGITNHVYLNPFTTFCQ